MQKDVIQNKENSGHESSALSNSGFDGADHVQSQSPPPFQLKTTESNPIQRAAAPHSQIASNMGAQTGHDLSNVEVNYNSSKPSAVGALAYAQGNTIEVAPRQEKHVGHEMGHIVQQREGRVKANTEVNGMPVNNDKGLESEADRMGDAAM